MTQTYEWDYKCTCGNIIKCKTAYDETILSSNKTKEIVEDIENNIEEKISTDSTNFSCGKCDKTYSILFSEIKKIGKVMKIDG